MSLINVLWIEDNPLQEALRVQDIIDRNPIHKAEFPTKELCRLSIPAIHFDTALKTNHQFYNLQVLQHPIEIKDYISMCLMLLDRGGYSLFENKGLFIPDIIVFDYHFGTNIAINQGNGAISYNPRTRAIRKYVNPNFKFKEAFPELFAGIEFALEKPENENYSSTDFLIEICKAKDGIRLDDRKDLMKDDFGLLSAIEILRIFREHITVAVPATYNKKSIEELSLHGKYFEWLNEYDVSISFRREERGSKKWDFILKDAAKGLQSKIKNFLGLGKIDIALSFLKALSEKEIPSDRLFKFFGSCENKSLPLDGLFLNIPEESRDQHIASWALELLGVYSKRLGFTFEAYEKAREKSGILIKSFRNNAEIDKRVIFSELIVKRILNKSSLEEEQLLGELMEHFGVTKEKIDEFIDQKKKRSENFSLEKNYIDFRELKTNHHAIDRLIVLFSDLRLHKIYEDFRRKTKVDDSTYESFVQLFEKPTYSDLRCVLFPIARNPLVLPEHEMYLPEKYQKKDPFEVWDNHLTANVMGEARLLPKSRYPANLSPSEKDLCTSFCNEIQLSKEYYPQWLLI